jgi:hypothetical protein
LALRRSNLVPAGFVVESAFCDELRLRSGRTAFALRDRQVETIEAIIVLDGEWTGASARSIPSKLFFAASAACPSTPEPFLARPSIQREDQLTNGKGGTRLLTYEISR